MTVGDFEQAKVKISTVAKLLGVVFVFGGMWTTTVIGQRENSAQLRLVAGHLASIDTSLAVARVVFMTRDEIHDLLRQADSTHAAFRSRIEALEQRIPHL